MPAENRPQGQETPKGMVKVKEVVTSKGKVIQVFIPKKRR